MGHKANQRKDNVVGFLADGTDGSELSLLLVAASMALTLPWTLVRLARLTWHIENKQGRTDHHKRILGILTSYFLFWAGAIVVVVVGGYFFLHSLG